VTLNHVLENMKLIEICGDITMNECGKMGDTREFSSIGPHRKEINVGGRKRISSLRSQEN